MNKKNIFENELALGMDREMHSYAKKQGMKNLVKAAEYLNSAVDIFEEAGLKSNADKVLRILGKIAAEDLNDAKKHKKENVKNLATPQEDSEFYKKLLNWIQNPTTPVDPANVQPGEELQFKSLMHEKPIESGDEISFRSLRDENEAKQKADKHTKGLTPEKMTKNLKHHGTVFNMVNDGNFAEDLLNIEINDEPLEVSENDLDKTFEDSD